MKSFKILLLSFFLIGYCTAISAQKKTIDLSTKKFSAADKKALEKAEGFFSEMEYLKAIPVFEQLSVSFPEEEYFKYRLGMCYLHKQDAYDKAVEYLKPVAEEYPTAADVKFYLGKAYHLTYKFDEAIKEFNEYLAQDIHKSQRPITERLIENCNYGKELMAEPIRVTISNIGSPVNTEGSEYVPVVSADEQTMLFTHMGQKSKGGFEDIFSTKKKNNEEWEMPKALGDHINGYDHDACIALSPDGQTLFVYKDSKDKEGEIYYCLLEEDEWTKPLPLPGDVNTKYWEGSASISTDGKTLFFTSEKPGGLGGRDIYKATLVDGAWRNIENLGPTINTEYNDDAPFIHPDGVTMVFSSEGHHSMGGYDIFYTHLKKDGTWSYPLNIGYPINSPDRDTYYVLSADGETGYFSSGRPGGKGLQDIYTSKPGLANYKPAIAILKGKITVNGEPAEAEIVSVYSSNGAVVNTQASNKETGDYLAHFPTGKSYEVTYKLKNYDYSLLKGDSVFMKTINVSDVDSFIEINIDIPFFTLDYLVEEPIVLKDMTYEDVLLALGDLKVEGLIFKVQIAAYNMPENYEYKRLNGLGDVEKLVLEDGVTRFTIGGEYLTLKDANVQRDKTVERGQDDAFITAIYKGKRAYLQELINDGVLKPIAIK